MEGTMAIIKGTRNVNNNLKCSLDADLIYGRNGDDILDGGAGNDQIFDFGEGDQIVIRGHTVSIAVEYLDTVSDADQDTDADYTVITLTSDQGGAGAHDGDFLGTITVYGDLVDAADVVLDTSVFNGIDLLHGAMI
jgi:Ca2+-binding RTX toxin-like protein